MVDAGAKVSISPETELNMGMGRPVFAACRRHGLKPTLSCDVISLNSGDLLTQLRLGLGFSRWADWSAARRSASTRTWTLPARSSSRPPRRTAHRAGGRPGGQA
jgi:cytosine/adenosine deaminase-related metal-dependent hydrolase